MDSANCSRRWRSLNIWSGMDEEDFPSISSITASRVRIEVTLRLRSCLSHWMASGLPRVSMVFRISPSIPIMRARTTNWLSGKAMAPTTNFWAPRRLPACAADSGLTTPLWIRACSLRISPMNSLSTTRTERFRVRYPMTPSARYLPSHCKSEGSSCESNAGTATTRGPCVFSWFHAWNGNDKQSTSTMRIVFRIRCSFRKKGLMIKTKNQGCGGPL